MFPLTSYNTVRRQFYQFCSILNETAASVNRVERSFVKPAERSLVLIELSSLIFENINDYLLHQPNPFGQALPVASSLENARS